MQTLHEPELSPSRHHQHNSYFPLTSSFFVQPKLNTLLTRKDTPQLWNLPRYAFRITAIVAADSIQLTLRMSSAQYGVRFTWPGKEHNKYRLDLHWG